MDGLDFFEPGVITFSNSRCVALVYKIPLFVYMAANFSAKGLAEYPSSRLVNNVFNVDMHGISIANSVNKKL